MPVAKKEAFNPFYFFLVLVGVVFLLTACSYGVMAFKKRDYQEAAASAAAGSGLTEFMDEHGMTLLLVELAVLAVATFGAMATDRHWIRRAEAKRKNESAEKRSPP